jgi:hypothetical protein
MPLARWWAVMQVDTGRATKRWVGGAVEGLSAVMPDYHVWLCVGYWLSLVCPGACVLGGFRDFGSSPHPVQLLLVRDHSLISCVGCTMWLPLRWFLAGCPSFFARLPVLGGLLRQVSLGTIKRLVEDLMLIVKKVRVEGGGCVSSFLGS